MKGFIEIVTKGNKPRLINVRYIEEVAEVDESHCEIYMHDPSVVSISVHLPYNIVVDLIKEAME